MLLVHIRVQLHPQFLLGHRCPVTARLNWASCQRVRPLPRAARRQRRCRRLCCHLLTLLQGCWLASCWGCCQGCGMLLLPMLRLLLVGAQQQCCRPWLGVQLQYRTLCLVALPTHNEVSCTGAGQAGLVWPASSADARLSTKTFQFCMLPLELYRPASARAVVSPWPLLPIGTDGHAAEHVFSQEGAAPQRRGAGEMPQLRVHARFRPTAVADSQGVPRPRMFKVRGLNRCTCSSLTGEQDCWLAFCIPQAARSGQQQGAASRGQAAGLHHSR